MLGAEQKSEVVAIQDAAKRNVLLTVSTFPCVMLVCYLAMVLYFRSLGGYRPQMIVKEEEEELMMTGGTTGPSEY
jgi:hypothetical protein